MIYPRLIWAAPEGTEDEQRKKRKDQKDNDKAVRDLCDRIAKQIVGSVTMIPTARVESVTSGYARTLATLLQHLKVGPLYERRNEIAGEAERLILAAADRFWFSTDSTKLPPPLHLLVRAHYAYAYPGGEEIQWYFQFTNFVFRPYGSLTEFEFSCSLMDRWWNDTLTRIAWEHKRDTPKCELSEKDRLAFEYMTPPRETSGSQAHALLLKEPGGAKKWDEWARWIPACRTRVPTIKFEE